MLLSPHIERLQSDVRAIAQLGDDRTREIADSLSLAMESAIRHALIAALTQIAHESTKGTLTLDGDSVTVTQPSEVVETLPATERTARFALRLPDELKQSIESSAARAGLSVNSWIVNTLHDAVNRKKATPPSSGKTVRGRGRA